MQPPTTPIVSVHPRRSCLLVPAITAFQAHRNRQHAHRFALDDLEDAVDDNASTDDACYRCHNDACPAHRHAAEQQQVCEDAAPSRGHAGSSKLKHSITISSRTANKHSASHHSGQGGRNVTSHLCLRPPLEINRTAIHTPNSTTCVRLPARATMSSLAGLPAGPMEAWPPRGDRKMPLTSAPTRRSDD